MVSMPRALAARDAEMAELRAEVERLRDNRPGQCPECGFTPPTHTHADGCTQANEMAQLRRDNDMLRRQNEELLTTSFGELFTRNEELTAQIRGERQAHALELRSLRSELAAERERWVK
jgi:hypothetical protein